MQKILIIAPSWVGDAVLAQPLFKKLHEIFHPLALDVFAPAWTAPLYKRMAEVGAVIENPLRHGELNLPKRWRLGRELSRTGYDRAIVLPNSAKSALVPLFAGIKIRTGYRGEMRWGLINDVRALDERKLPQMAERFYQLAQSELSRPLPPLSLKADEAQCRTTLAALGLQVRRPVAALCPGAEYGPSKRWPAPHFAQLAQRLQASGYDVWLIGSENDAGIGAEIEKLSGGGARNLCGLTKLDQAIDLLATASVVVSNDSGLMHVASALGRPLIAIYGSSSPAFTPPLSQNARVVKLDLPCSPCFQRVCPLGHFNCMMQLTPDAVFAKIEQQRPVL